MVRLEPDYYALGRRLHDLRGKVQTYGWDCETNQYENIADDLFGQHSYQYFGLSAQLSDNGEVLLVQSQQQIDVYRGEQTEWIHEITHSKMMQVCGWVPNVPIFSMNKMGTIFAVLDVLGDRVGVTMYRWDGQLWNDSWYEMTIVDSQMCSNKLGIALSDDDGMTATLFGPMVGIVRVSFAENEIIQIDRSNVTVAAGDPSISRDTFPHFSASVAGSAIMYSLRKPWAISDPADQAERHVIMEYHGHGGWTTLFNTTTPQRGTTGLTSRVGVLYNIRGSSLDILVPKYDNDEWYLLKSVEMPGGVLGVQLTSDGSFLSVLDVTNTLRLYSLNLP